MPKASLVSLIMIPLTPVKLPPIHSITKENDTNSDLKQENLNYSIEKEISQEAESKLLS